MTPDHQIIICLKNTSYITQIIKRHGFTDYVVAVPTRPHFCAFLDVNINAFNNY